MKCKKYGQYQCKNGKSTPKCPAKIDYDKGSKSTVTGFYCKNNCELYNNGCKIFKKCKKTN